MLALQALGLAVRKRRQSLGISQEVLAAKSGLHRTYVSDIERGARNPSWTILLRLASGLETSLAALQDDAAGSKSRSRGKKVPSE